MSRMWHYVRNGQAQAPVPEEQLRAMLAAGAVRREDLVWREGMGAWTPAGQVPELAPPQPAYAPPPPAYAPPPPPAPVYAPPPPQAPAPAYAPYQAPAAALGSPAGVPGAVSPTAVELLRRTKPWVRLLGVLGAIGLFFVVIAALVVLAGVTPPFNQAPIGMRVMAAGVYLVMSLLYLPPIIFLNRYASRIASLVQTNDPSDLDEALAAQKSFWKYVGILTLIAIVLSVIAIPAAILLPMLLNR